MLTKEQRKSLRCLYEQSADGSETYLQFRHRARLDTLMDCVMIHWCGMWIGIERDGYTHS